MSDGDLKKAGRGRPTALKRHEVNFYDDSPGGLIRRARYEKKLSLEEIATPLGVSHQHINNIEKGRSLLPWDLLLGFSDLLEIDARTLARRVLESSQSYQKYQKVLAEIDKESL